MIYPKRLNLLTCFVQPMVNRLIMMVLHCWNHRIHLKLSKIEKVIEIPEEIVEIDRVDLAAVDGGDVTADIMLSIPDGTVFPIDEVELNLSINLRQMICPAAGQSNIYTAENGDRILSLNASEWVLCDLEGRVLRRFNDYVSFFTGTGGDSALLYTTEFVHDKPQISIYDRDGKFMIKVIGMAEQFYDRLILADGDCYRLTDLEGRDLIRLSRWITADIPAEE